MKFIILTLALLFSTFTVKADDSYKNSKEYLTLRDSMHHAFNSGDYAKAMICLVDADSRLQRYVRNVPNVAWDILELSEKPTTLILDGAVNLAPSLVGEDGSIALRITREAFSRELCYRFQKPIVSTSANISGAPAASNYRDICDEILGAVDYVCHTRRQEHLPHEPSSIIKLRMDGEVSIIRK